MTSSLPQTGTPIYDQLVHELNNGSGDVAEGPGPDTDNDPQIRDTSGE